MATSKKATAPKRKVSSSRRPARAGNAASSGEKVQASLKSSLPVISIPRQYRPVLYALVSAVLILAAVILFYTKIYADPYRVFWSMVGNNLSTPGFTRETPQTACVPNAQSTNILQTTFTPSLTIKCITHIDQGNAKLVIESIGTTEADYQRYSHVQTTAEAPKADKYAKIYSMWLKNNGSDTATPTLYGQLLNSPALFGYFSKPQRDKLTEELKTVYTVDYKKVTKRSDGLRQSYIYTVVIPLKKFAVAEKTYADAMRLPIGSRINPASYPANSKVSVKFTVDVLSRELRQVEFQSVKETYGGYGIIAETAIPKKTVSLQELQNAFQSVK